jgi:hypothetical protein
VGGIVVGDEDDRSLGVLGPELGEDLMSAPLRQQAPEAPASRWQLVGGERRSGRPGDGGERPREPAAAPGGDSGNGAGAGEKPQRPPEGSVRLGLLLDPDVGRPSLAELLCEPFRRLSLSL